jgi:hypothetical protein
MTTTSTPFGFRPIISGVGGTGAEQPVNMIPDGLGTAYGTTIGTGCPVKLAADGTIALKGVADALHYGVFCGVDYVDSDGRQRTRPYWPASTAATQINVYIWRSPFLEFQIQGATALTKAALGDEADHVAGTVNALSGQSTDYFGTLVGAGNSACYRITGLMGMPNNDWTDTYPIIRVMPNEVAGLVGFGGANAV